MVWLGRLGVGGGFEVEVRGMIGPPAGAGRGGGERNRSKSARSDPERKRLISHLEHQNA